MPSRLLHTFVLSCLILATIPADSRAQSYGLTQRPNVGPYLDGIMPTEPPAVGSDWSTVVAFPNLSFLNPLGITSMPGTSKLVVWEREGRVYQFNNSASTSSKTLILNLSNQCQGWDDCGLLGLAFHPNFTTNHFVYVWYNWVSPGTVIGGPNAGERPPKTTPTRNRLSRFTLDSNGVAVASSELVLIDQKCTTLWHNGGGLFFHPQNGFLYLSIGDDEVTGNNQRIDLSFFSCVLRLDVDKRGGSISHAPPKRAANEVSANWPQYFVPNDNPFVGVPSALEEIYALGLRSPHRMTYDGPSGRIFIGDVGQSTREEVDVIEPTDPSGLNFQWNVIEGINGDLTPPYIGVNKPPIFDFLHENNEKCVIGGYVYRGQQFPELFGKYIFGDNSTGNIYFLDESQVPTGRTFLAVLPDGPGPNTGNDYRGLSSFGTDANGEMYICQMSSTSAHIYKLQRGGPAPGTPLPAKLSQTSVFSDLTNLTPSNKLIPYAINVPFWSDGAVKTRWAVIPNTANVGFSANGDWTFPEGSVFVKHFELPVDDNDPNLHRRLETRLLVKMATGEVYGATYKWRADNSDADLLDGSLTENVPVAITPIGTLTGLDIGSPGLAGSTVRSGNDYTIQASGTDIWGTSDKFHFAYQQRTGDFDVRARVQSLTNTNLNTKAGLMARETLSASSRHLFAIVYPTNAARGSKTGGYDFQFRSATAGTTTAVVPPADQPLVNYPNTWVRLRREGNTFISFSSSDGTNWKEYSRRTMTMPATLFLGFAVTSHNNTAKTTAVFKASRLQPWFYPSRLDCITCHNSATPGALGLKTRQLSKDLLYPNGVTDNQVRAWNHVGLFDNAPAESDIPNFEKLAPATDATASLEKRARSYLDANCSQCHRPDTGIQALWDARYSTPLSQQGIINGPLANDLGISGAAVVKPQDLSRSIMYYRVNRVGQNQMPPLARNFIDTTGASLLANWINSLSLVTPPIEAETLAVEASSGDTVRVLSESAASGGATLMNDSNAVNDFVTLRIPNISAGTYSVKIRFKKHPSRGTVQVMIGKIGGALGNVGTPVDLYAATPTYQEVNIGTWTPGTTSDKQISFKIVGKNANSTGYTQCVDSITLTPQ